MSRKPVEVEYCLYAEQRTLVEPHVIRAVHYAPTATESISVRYDNTEDNLASTSTAPEYRTANIRIGNGWFSETPDQQSITFIHEVLHGYVEALAVVFSDLLKATVPDEEAPLRKWAEEQWRRAEEGMISELSHRIHEREKMIP